VQSSIPRSRPNEWDLVDLWRNSYHATVWHVCCLIRRLGFNLSFQSMSRVQVPAIFDSCSPAWIKNTRLHHSVIWLLVLQMNPALLPRFQFSCLSPPTAHVPPLTFHPPAKQSSSPPNSDNQAGPMTADASLLTGFDKPARMTRLGLSEGGLMRKIKRCGKWVVEAIVFGWLGCVEGAITGPEQRAVWGQEGEPLDEVPWCTKNKCRQYSSIGVLLYL
jgi:hypothetical protein